jgi:hypothetical protein
LRYVIGALERRDKGIESLIFKAQDLDQVEDWNEFGELKEAIGTVATTATSHTTTPAIAPGRSAASGTPDASYASTNPGVSGLEAPLAASSLGPGAAISDALRKAAFESASAAKDKKAAPAALATPVDPTPPPPAPTPVEGAPTTPAKVPLPASPLTKEPAQSIGEVMTPTTSSTGGPIASPPPRAASAGSSHSSHFVPEHYDAPVMTHRGSTLSIASQEEIKEIECREAIQEEDEEDDEEDVPQKKPVVEAAKAVIDAPKAVVEKVKAAVSSEPSKTEEETVVEEKAETSKAPAV